VESNTDADVWDAATQKKIGRTNSIIEMEPGTYTIEADTLGSVGEIAVFAYLLSGVDLTKLATHNGTTGNGQNPSLSIDSIVDNSIMLAVCSTEASIIGVGANQTIWGPLTDQSFENASSSTKIPKTPLGTDSSSFSTGSGQSYALSGLFLAPAVAEVRGNLLQMFQ